MTDDELKILAWRNLYDLERLRKDRQALYEYQKEVVAELQARGISDDDI
jgi:hypothetical protein